MNKYYIFQWHITDRCDQRCKHCYIYAENNINKICDMTVAEFSGVISNCISFCNQIGRKPYFCITGGDPILHPNFWVLLDLLKNNNIHFTVLGNPFHIDNKVARRLKEYGCDCYQMSLDGLRETHDWFRKTGSFDETLRSVHYINEANITSAIMTTVSKKNMYEIPELMELVAENKVGVYSFSRYCPTSEEKTNGINPLEYKELLRKYEDKEKILKKRGFITRFEKKDHLWALYKYEEQGVDGIINMEPCRCINEHLTIIPTGDIYICRRVQQDGCIGNIFDDSLYDIYEYAIKTYKDISKFKKCMKCEIADKCLGCPAVANSSTGDFFSDDPQCWK